MRLRCLSLSNLFYIWIIGCASEEQSFFLFICIVHCTANSLFLTRASIYVSNTNITRREDRRKHPKSWLQLSSITEGLRGSSLHFCSRSICKSTQTKNYEYFFFAWNNEKSYLQSVLNIPQVNAVYYSVIIHLLPFITE